ncbi:hypothetical protein C8R43DRAFT_965872 [Mycena crocata]|nr:hypothetical protein C8R43DRAFT_965872 [Mycena crocata]
MVICLGLKRVVVWRSVIFNPGECGRDRTMGSRLTHGSDTDVGVELCLAVDMWGRYGVGIGIRGGVLLVDYSCIYELKRRRLMHRNEGIKSRATYLGVELVGRGA